MSKKFRTFDEFFLFYLRQHSSHGNRMLHFLGTTVGLVMTIATMVLGHPWLALLWIPVGYAFSWAGHLLVEGNRPATWGHPGWSLLCDFRMLGLMITGRLNAWMANAHAAESRAHTATASAQD
jgi:hypothetical protein